MKIKVDAGPLHEALARLRAGVERDFEAALRGASTSSTAGTAGTDAASYTFTAPGRRGGKTAAARRAAEKEVAGEVVEINGRRLLK